MVCVQVLCGVCTGTMWCVYRYYVVCVQVLCGVCTGTMWCVYQVQLSSSHIHAVVSAIHPLCVCHTTMLCLHSIQICHQTPGGHQTPDTGWYLRPISAMYIYKLEGVTCPQYNNSMYIHTYTYMYAKHNTFPLHLYVKPHIDTQRGLNVCVVLKLTSIHRIPYQS